MLESVRNAWRIEDLRRKMIFSLMILAIYRIGSVIPVPFLNPQALQAMVGQSGNILGYLNTLSGGAFGQCTLFALSISPYITASIVMQLLTIAIPYLENLQKEGGEEGQKLIKKYTRYTVVALSFLQSWAYSTLLKNQGAMLFSTGWQQLFTRIVIIFAFAGGALMVVYLGERIDEKGIGNGISMILFAGIVSRGGSVLLSAINTVRLGLNPVTEGAFLLDLIMLPVMLVLAVVAIAFVVVMTNAERRIPVQYAKKVVGRKMYGGQSTFMPIKITMSGVLPVIFASSIMAVPTSIRDFAGITAESGWIHTFLSAFSTNRLSYAVVYFLLIMAFNYFYVSIQYNPIEIANNLQKNSGTVPGIRPGRPTAAFLSRIVSRTTVMGGVFLSIIAVVPIVVSVISGGRLNVSLGGTSLIIVVGVALDTVKSLESMMMMRHYKGFLE